MAPTLPPIATLAAADDAAIAAALDLLFEPSPALHARALPAVRAHLSSSSSSPSPSPSAAAAPTWRSTIRAVGAVLSALADESESGSASSRAAFHAILSSHPRLGAARVDSAQSRAEQANLQQQQQQPSPTASTNSAAAAAAAKEAANNNNNNNNNNNLPVLNAQYEAAYPGMRYVVFVAGRARPAIVEDMRARIAEAGAGSGVAGVAPPELVRREERRAAAAMVDIALDRAGKLGGGDSGAGA